jgi:hypothetical protein
VLLEGGGAGVMGARQPLEGRGGGPEDAVVAGGLTTRSPALLVVLLGFWLPCGASGGDVTPGESFATTPVEADDGGALVESLFFLKASSWSYFLCRKFQVFFG